MKVMNIALIIAVFSAAITFHADSFARSVNKSAVQQAKSPETVVESTKSAEATVTVEREKVEQAIIDTEAIKTAATLAINKAREQLAKGEISRVDAAKIIGEQDYRIEQANKLLAMATKRAVDTVEQAEVEESYASQLISGARGLGARVLAPFKSGYGYSEEEKAIARAIIAELNRQLEVITKEYDIKMNATDLKAQPKYIEEFAAIKKEFDDAIYQQQLITGDVMSTNRKLFWGAVGLAGSAIGAALAQQYLNMELPVVPTSGPKEPIMPTVSETSGLGDVVLPAQEIKVTKLPQILEQKQISEQPSVKTPTFSERLAESADYVVRGAEAGEEQVGISQEKLAEIAKAAGERIAAGAGSVVERIEAEEGQVGLSQEELAEIAEAAAARIKKRAELVTDQPINPLEVDILAEDTPSEVAAREALAIAAETAADVARVTGEGLKKVETTIGQELEKRRHHEKPLTPAQVLQGLQEKGGELAEGVKSAVQTLGQSASQEYAETVGAPQVYEGAEVGESLSERYPAETEQEYRARREKAQRTWQNPAEAAVQAQKEFMNRPRRSAEEQAEIASELGGQIYEGVKSTGKAFFGAPQNREFGQDPLALENEEDSALKAKFEDLKASAQQRGAKLVESIDESGLPQRIIVREPSELPFD